MDAVPITVVILAIAMPVTVGIIDTMAESIFANMVAIPAMVMPFTIIMIGSVYVG